MTDEEIAAMPMAISHSNVLINDPSALRALIEDIERLREEWGLPVVMIVVDTLAMNFSGDENSAKDVGLFIQGLNELRARYLAHAMFLHHVGKAGDMRGSTALFGNVDCVLRLEDAPGGLLLVNQKLKDSREAAPIPYEIESVDLGVDADGEDVFSAAVSRESMRALDEVVIQARPKTKARPARDSVTLGDIAKVILAAGGPCSQAVLLLELERSGKRGLEQSTLSRRLALLQERGLLVRVGEGGHKTQVGLSEACMAILSVNGMLLDRDQGKR
jgi:hypothetical protein